MGGMTMILLIDTSTSVCKLSLVTADQKIDYQADFGRQMARELLTYIGDRLSENGGSLEDLSGLGVMKGPGSFTGLRIGATVCNTLASQLNVPIVGEMMAEDWQNSAIEKLRAGVDQRIVLPEYGAGPNITQPKK